METRPTFWHPVGVATHLFRGSPEVVAATCRRHGLTCVQLTPNFPGLGFHEPGLITPERGRRAAEPFRAAGLAVAALSAPTNLLDPDLARRHRGLLRLHALLRQACDFGTEAVVTESGNLNPESPWEPCPVNRTAAARRELVLILREALRAAEDGGSRLLLKPSRAHVVASLDDALRLYDEVGHAALGFVLDPAELLHDVPREERPERMVDIVDRLSPLAPLVHLKDLQEEADGTVSLPRIGLGELDVGRLLRQLDRYQPEAPLVLEHLRPDDVEAARSYVEARGAGRASQEG
jgi:sugar phosphate isomerase/epimerase